MNAQDYDYQVIEARSTAELTERVLAARGEGWRLIGGMSSHWHTVLYRETYEPGIDMIVASGGNSYNVFCQAMMRHKPDERSKQ